MVDGHPGAGGRPHSLLGVGYGLNGTPPLDQVAFADPRSGVAFGYTRRRFGFGWAYPEHDRIAAAVHRAATGHLRPV